MPLYEYRCEACGRQFEVIRKFSDPELDVCTLCGKGPVQRLVSSPAIQFKGTGWYITDYAQKGKSSTPTSSSTTGSESKPAASGTSTPASGPDTPAPSTTKGPTTKGPTSD